MRDALPLAVLVLLLLGAATVIVGVLCLTTAGLRGAHRLLHPKPRRRLPAPALPVQRRYVWVACDTPRCGHLQTPHYPAGPGRVECNHCGTVRPRP
ncbi:hypothetical protein ACFXGT_11510 [Streptomyces sp. NPDC059352]|uniref:hypothetical protein n=1 Tax=Streptomyces sp. NPDC059352 TaxID=3346810 RepID=UPI003676B860